MDNIAPKETTYTDIRDTIQRVIFPLVRALYDENPSDEIQFCTDYFKDLLQKRKSNLENMNHQIPNSVGESSQKKDESMEYQYKNIESLEIPSSVQGSASAPLLSTGKKAEILNVRESSSWDTPSNVTDPIKSLAVLKDVVCGIGDQPSVEENQMAMKNDIRAGDVATSLKHDSFDENTIVNKVTIDSVAEAHSCSESTEENFETLCTQFEILEFSKSDYSGYNDSNQETKDIKMQCRKQLSPNSSFGFVPHQNESGSLNDMIKIDSEDSRGENLSGKIISRKIAGTYLDEHDPEKEMEKKDSGDSDGERSKTQIEKLSKIARKVSQTFHGLEDTISSTKAHLNDKFQDAEEISDVIQKQNTESAMDFDNTSDQISASGKDFIEEKQNEITSITSGKYELDSNKDTNNTSGEKINPSGLESPFTQMCSFLRNMLDSEEKGDENEKTDVTDPMDFQKENSPAKEKPETIVFINHAEIDNGKSDEFESQIVFEKMPGNVPVFIKSERKEGEEAEKINNGKSDELEPQIVFEKMPVFIKSEKKEGEEAEKIDNSKSDEFEPQIVFEKMPSNMPVFIKSERKEGEEAEKIFSEPMNSQQETFADKEKPDNTVFESDAEDDNGEFGEFEPQIVFEHMPTNMSVHFKSEINGGEEGKTDFIEPMNSQQKKLPDEEKLGSPLVRNEAEDDHDKYNQFEPQIVVQKPWRRKLFESQPSVHKSKISQFKEKGDECVKTNFTNPMDFQHETFPDKENPKTTFSRNEAEEDHDKSDKSLPQIVVNKLPRKRWNEARSLDGFSTSHRRDPRLNREQYPARRPNTGEAGDVPPRHNFEEAGDVPPDRFYIPNSSMNRRSRCQITSESSRVIAEFNYSGSCSNEIRRRSNSTRPSDNLSERKAPGEKTHQCEDNVKEDVSVVLTTDQNVTIGDTQEALSETNLSTDSKDKSQSNLYNEDIVTCDNSVTEEDNGKQNWKQCSIEVIEMAKKRSDRNLVLTDAQKEKPVNQHTKIPMKCGLDAACGDFISSVNDANERDDDYETVFIDPGENEGNRMQQNNEISRGISMEYFEEVIGKVIEEQKDAQEDLNISFYPESDSSYIEIEESSDFSDTDDFTMQDQ